MRLMAAMILWVSVSCIGFMENSVNVGFSHDVTSYHLSRVDLGEAMVLGTD